MKPSDPERDLEKELEMGPFEQSGFTRELRRKIEEQIDERSLPQKPWTMLSGIITLCFVLMCAGISLSFPGIKPQANEDAAVRQAAFEPEPAEDAAALMPIDVRSGLLIGLRGEDPFMPYRTLYIAPEDGQLRLVAEGSGILVPYGQQFWKIEQRVHRTDTDEYRYLVSYPAGRTVAPAMFADRQDEKVTYTEKLLFVGNDYISVEETGERTTAAGVTRSGDVYVTRIPWLSADLEAKGRQRSGPAARHHVTIGEVFGLPGGNAEAADAASRFARAESWTLVRKQGRWVPLVLDAATLRAASGGDGDAKFLQLDVTPPAAMVSHDTLCCSWADIAAVQPKAIDALSSPTGDMVAVLTESEFFVYPKNDAILAQPALKIALRKNESLVMAQWATDHYVNEWADKAKLYLK